MMLKYNTILKLRYVTILYYIYYSIILYSTIQYRTVEYRIVLYRIECNTVQYRISQYIEQQNTVQYSKNIVCYSLVIAFWFPPFLPPVPCHPAVVLKRQLSIGFYGSLASELRRTKVACRILLAYASFERKFAHTHTHTQRRRRQRGHQQRFR